jgi:PhnB protein
MSDTSLDPYIYFKGRAKEAAEFYKGVFGGKLTTQTYKEFPDPNMPGIKEHPDWLMHGRLEGDVGLMVCDTDKASPKAAKIELSLSGSDDAKLRQYWDGLAKGGKVRYPLEKAPWGDTFGMLIDKFGVDWMVNITAPQK